MYVLSVLSQGLRRVVLVHNGHSGKMYARKPGRRNYACPSTTGQAVRNQWPRAARGLMQCRAIGFGRDIRSCCSERATPWQDIGATRSCHQWHWRMGGRTDPPSLLSSRWRRVGTGDWASLNVRCWIRDTLNGIDELGSPHRPLDEDLPPRSIAVGDEAEPLEKGCRQFNPPHSLHSRPSSCDVESVLDHLRRDPTSRYRLAPRPSRSAAS